MVNAASRSIILHAVGSTLPSKQGTGNIHGSLETDVVTSLGSRVCTPQVQASWAHARCFHSYFMRLLRPQCLFQRRRLCSRQGHLAEAPALPRHFWDLHKLVPPLFSTCGDDSEDAQRIPEGLAKRRTGKHRVSFRNVGEAALILRETGTQRSGLSTTLQDTRLYRTRICPEKQTIVRRCHVDSEILPAMTSIPPPGGTMAAAPGSGEDSEERRRHWGRCWKSVTRGEGRG